MPLFRKSRLSETTSLGIWKIDETPDLLRRNIHLWPAEIRYYESIRSDLRKKHWLGYRNVISCLLGQDPPELLYDENGKPYPASRGFHLSVSHSGIFSAAIISTGEPVGIDIETLKDRVERVKERFLSAEECAAVGNKNRLEKLYIYWGAKESLYKLYGKPGVEFGKDILVDPFVYEEPGTGVCTAKLNTPEGNHVYALSYERIEGYMLVYICG